MAKKQTRRSISLSRTTYERLKAFCEVNEISMSQFVETRVGDFLGRTAAGAAKPVSPAADTVPTPRPVAARPVAQVPQVTRTPIPVIMKAPAVAPKPTADSIFTF
jgi:hypothetical protein